MKPAPTVVEAPEKGRDVVQLKLSSPRSQYLLGEPVDLRIELTNVSDQPFRRWDQGDEYLDQIFRVYYSHEGNSLGRYLSGIGRQFSWELLRETYQPGETKHYRIMVLYQHERAEPLALVEPGRYRFKVAFPLPGRKDPLDIGNEWGIPMAKSNTIEVNLVEPQGADKEIFKLIKQPEYLYLSHTGWAGKPEDCRALKLLELLQADPNSEYVPALRQGLAMYYESNESYEDLGQRDQIREAIGIESKELFPDDRRLDQEIELKLTEKTSIPDLVRKVSDLSGVPLDASEELNRRSMKGKIGPVPLRTFLKRRQSPITAQYWERKGDDYFLHLGPFAEDRGLHGRVLVYFPDASPLSEVLRHISKRANNRFEASPELQEHKIQMAVETDERALMRRLSALTDATWVRRGEGYYLTREPEKFEQDSSEENKSDTNP